MTALGVAALSAREAEVLEALGEHHTNAEIARQLHISVRTVESHVSSLLRKLDARDRRDLASMAAAVAALPVRRDAQITGLPGTWTSFIGRTAERAEIADALGSSRLVTLLGPGGMGKTRLAILAAQDAAPAFPAGGAFVNLVPVAAEFVVQAVAASLDVVERAQERLEAVVHARLREGPTLLVLDNCEHVLAAAARFVQAALATCPEAVVLATSRERLGLSGERVISIPPLDSSVDHDVADAERLFLDRAADAAGGSADPVLVAEICRRLDGSPLAIELAAARSGSLGLDGLIAGLDDHLRLLSRSRSGDDRHGSLRSVIDWSHQLLDDDERVVFRRLGLFSGAFDLASAATVAADGDLGLASDTVGRLTDKSLLVHAQGPGGSRWRMLETVHAFAREQLEASGEADDVRRRHLAWAATTAGALESGLDDGPGWHAAFDPVADDLRAALAAAPVGEADGAISFGLARSLAHLTYARRFLVEAGTHFAAAVARAPDARAAVDALRTAAGAAYAEMRGEDAFELLLDAFERASAAAVPDLAAIVLAEASIVGGRAPGTFVHPVPHERLVELTEQARAIGPVDDLAVRTHLALAAAWDGALGVTVPDPGWSDEGLRLARELDDPRLISCALDAVASSVSFDGHLKEAARITAERLDLLDRLPRHDPRVGGEVADVFHMAGETTMASGQLPLALTIARRSYDDTIRQGLDHLGTSQLVPPLILQGSFDEGLHYAAIMREGWDRAHRPVAGWMAPAFFAVAMTHGLRGDPEAAAPWWELAEVVGSQSRHVAFGHFAPLRVALHLGDHEQAETLAAVPAATFSGAYWPYANGLVAEAAVVLGRPDAEAQLAAVEPLAVENDFVAALLVRAAGRLHGDAAALERSVAGWEAIGARFERACTLLLLPERAAEGRRELDALGCPVPTDP